MILAEDLKLSILQKTMQGELSEQLDSDTPVNSTLQLAASIKNKLLEAKVIKKDKGDTPEVDVYPFDIPDTWAWVRLSDIGELSRGKSKHRPRNDSILYINGTIPLIQTGEVAGSGKYITSYTTCYNEVGLVQSRLWKKGTLCLTIAANIGDVAILTFDACFPDSVVGFVPFDRSISIEYVYYMLTSYKQRMNATASKVAQSNLSLAKISSLVFPFPPVEEQQRIVNQLNELMPSIDEYAITERAFEQLKQHFPVYMRDAMLQAALQGQLTEQKLSDSPASSIIDKMSKFHGRHIKPINDYDTPFNYPDNWLLVRLTDASVLYTGDSIPEDIKATRYTGLDSGYNYIGTKDVGFNHVINYDNGVKIPFDEPGFKYADKDASLLCIEGGSAGRKIAILEEKVCFGNKLCAFHPIGLNRRYLYYYLQSHVFLYSFKDGLSGIIGGVSINKIKKLTIPIPPIEEQQRIVDRLDALLPLCDTLIEV